MRRHRHAYYETPWFPKPPSERCETLCEGRACGRQAVAAYPAMGGGYHSLCAMHFPKHQNYCVTIDEARRGLFPKLLRPTPRTDG